MGWIDSERRTPVGTTRRRDDQAGNRARGERLSALVNFEPQKLAAGMTVLSPFVPLLFMGEEYAEPSPFLYFTSHGDKDLIEAVRLGRRREFSRFGWNDEAPHPQDETTFVNSRLQQHLRDADPHRTLRLFYQELIRFRRTNLLGFSGADADLEITESESPPVLTVVRHAAGRRLLMIFNFSAGEVELPSVKRSGSGTTELHSSGPRWLGPSDRFPTVVGPMNAITLSGQSFVVLSYEDRE
jgi:maltooligosyltrehalose trehalohydrolase